jgi:hypothetical protein
VQLLIGDELVAGIRGHGRRTGCVHCATAPGGTLLARRLAGCPEQCVRYDELVVDRHTSGTRRVPFLLAEPPARPEPWVLGSGTDLRPSDPWEPVHRVLGIPPPNGHQPYVAAALERSDPELLLVGCDDLALAWRRPAANRFGEIWQRLPVTVMPATLEDTGTNPLLRGRTFAVVGTGSVGSRVAELLAAAGVEALLLFDPDTLELRNVRRHLCGLEHLGRPKVEAVRDELARHGYPTVVEARIGRVQVDAPNEARELFARCDALICCTESAAARHFVNHSAVTLDTPCIIADIQIRPEPLAEVVVTVPGRGGCFNCWRVELETRGLMEPSDRHDPADYPGVADPTPSGLPMHQLTALAAATCDLTAVAMTPDASSMVQLTALDGPVPFFDDLVPRRPQLEALPTRPTCAVCS